MPWLVESLNAIVTAEIDALPGDMKAKFLRIVEMIQSSGLERMREPYVKHLDGRLWKCA